MYFPQTEYFGRSGSLSPSSPNETGEAAALLPIVQVPSTGWTLYRHSLDFILLSPGSEREVKAEKWGAGDCGAWTAATGGNKIMQLCFLVWSRKQFRYGVATTNDHSVQCSERSQTWAWLLMHSLHSSVCSPGKLVTCRRTIWNSTRRSDSSRYLLKATWKNVKTNFLETSWKKFP